MTAAWGLASDPEHRVAMEVLLRGPISRTELARRLDLSQPSLSRLTKPLLRRGLLIEVGRADSDGAGRPAILLDVERSSHHFAGIKVTGHHVRGALVDFRGEVVAVAETGLEVTEPARVAEEVAAVVHELDGHAVSAGLGVSVGGQVTGGSTVRHAGFLGWDRVDFAALVEARIARPTIVENDVAALLSAEHWFGIGREVETFLVITVGAGVGFGAVVHDRAIEGEDFGLGMVTHWPLDCNGPLCPEGHRGCAQAMLTDAAILSQAATALGRELSWEEFIDVAKQGQPAARRLLEEAASALGRFVGQAANLFLPEAVVLAGEGVEIATVARPHLETAMAAQRHPAASAPRIVVREPETVLWSRGAAIPALQAFARRER
ncbi:MAG: ROK family transcriptional regulator [Propionicimonas sp.]|uniref:ROK family transcriptional regulator n=1 Tax=Propionicimonas sp. TaxID=1955623 RepID=UPI002B20F09C|nr:ROK family transcriptional regulator [Propionicimonas sp.]MEA4943392.1 ROK family transcriptional regulator [Propionicimonas sp.]